MCYMPTGNASEPSVPTAAVCVCSTEAVRIPGIFPTPSMSLQLTFQANMKALAARGHQMTVITPNPLKVSVY